MSKIVINKTTGVEYILMYSRGDNVVLSRECGLGYINITKDKLQEEYQLKIDKRETIDTITSDTKKVKLPIDKLEAELLLQYRNLEKMKNSKTRNKDLERDLEIKLKNNTLELNRMIKILLNK
ncbi:hypothetical protein [uncultured Clostridium sp.]|jgi:hypothetical protein|uniref:hypothetical protein n=1 Tax=uncultured Clostridium sp. TaxID=59620 RepID=UPI0026219EAE|nr:hypothetical protein [uncultured Clostridium sp.]